MPDVSVSVGLDYAAFVTQANSATSKGLEQMVKNLAAHAKQFSILTGSSMFSSANRQIGATGGIVAMALGPITAPLAATVAAMATTMAVTGQAARHTSSVWKTETGKIRTEWLAFVATFAGATLFQRAAMGQHMRAAFAPVSVEFRKGVIGLGVWTANTFPHFWARAMRQFPSLDKFLHGKITATPGRNLTDAVLDPMKGQVIRWGVWFENTFPKFFAGAMNNFPALDKFLHGGKRTGTGAGLLATLGFIFGPIGAVIGGLATLVTTVLGGAFRILQSIVVAVFSIIKTILLGAWNIVTAFGKAVLYLGVGIGAALLAGVVRATEYGKELDSLARRSGYTSAQIEAGRLALYRSGQTAASTTEIFSKLRESLYFGSGPTLLSQLGLNAGGLQKLAPVDQFAAVAAAVNRIADPIMRAKVATELLGEAGANAVAQFQKGDANLPAAFKKYLADLAQGTSGLQLAADSWTRIKLNVEVFFNEIALKLNGVLAYVSKYFEDVLTPKAQAWGAMIGDKLKAIFNTIVGFMNDPNANLVDILELGFEIAVRYLGDLLIQVFTFGVALFQRLWADEHLTKALYATFAGLSKIIVWAFQSAMPAVAEMLGKVVGAMWSALNPIAKEEYRKTESQLANDAGDAVKAEQKQLDKYILAGQGNSAVANALRAQIAADQAAGEQHARNANDPLAGMAAEQGEAMRQWASDLFGKPDAHILDSLAAEVKTVVDSLGPLNVSSKELTAMWDAAKSQHFENPELNYYLSEMLKRFEASGAAITGAAGAAAAPAPGKGGDLGLGFMQTRFDAFRRVGGNLADLNHPANQAYRALGQGGMGPDYRSMGHGGSGPNYRAAGQPGSGPNYRAIGQPGNGASYRALTGPPLITRVDKEEKKVSLLEQINAGIQKIAGMYEDPKIQPPTINEDQAGALGAGGNVR